MKLPIIFCQLCEAQIKYFLPGRLIGRCMHCSTLSPLLTQTSFNRHMALKKEVLEVLESKGSRREVLQAIDKHLDILMQQYGKDPVREYHSQDYYIKE